MIYHALLNHFWGQGSSPFSNLYVFDMHLDKRGQSHVKDTEVIHVQYGRKTHLILYLFQAKNAITNYFTTLTCSVNAAWA